tara:strand:+ start:1129 stop:2178 length:1050 start_codon:yes stop_codon:yes gene_type:complete
MSYFKDKFEDATGIDLPDFDPYGAATDAGSSVWSAAEQEAKRQAANAQVAWGKMREGGQELWDKGADALSDVWSDTGMEDMAASWTDKAQMKETWMPGKWDWDTKFQSQWMAGLDMLKHMEGFSMSDFQQYRQNLFEEFDRWESATNTNIASANEGIENIIDENTDSLNDLESGINTTVSDAVENVEANVEGLANIADSGVSLINLAGDITHQGLDASININNPNSLIVNPQVWYDKNKEGAARGDWFFNSEEVEDTVIPQVGTFLKDAFQPQYDWLSEGVSGVASTFVGIGESLGSQFLRGGKTGLEGDPFGMEGPRRRDILEKKTFKDRGGATAPSRINQGGYGNIG